MKKFYVNKRTRLSSFIYSGVLAIISVIVGILWIAGIVDSIWGALIPSLSVSLLIFILGLLVGVKKICVSDAEIKYVFIRNKVTYQRSDLKEVFIIASKGGRLNRSLFSNHKMVLCFYANTGTLTIPLDFSLYECEEQCKQNPKIKFHAMELNEELLAELRKGSGIRILSNLS